MRGSLTAARRPLRKRLPKNYIARIEENFRVMEYPEKTEQQRYAGRCGRANFDRQGRPLRRRAIATLEPEVIPLVTTIIEEVKERWIEIRRRPDWAPVTIIELLSPTNKQGHGIQTTTCTNASHLIARSIHLVELDLLIGGQRLPMGRPLRRRLPRFGLAHGGTSSVQRLLVVDPRSTADNSDSASGAGPGRPARPGGDLQHGLSAGSVRAVDRLHGAARVSRSAREDRAWAEELARTSRRRDR